MLPEAILTIGKAEVHMYGVMIAVGLLACFATLFLFCKKKKISEMLEDFVFYNGIVTIVVGILSSMLFQAFYNYLKNPAAGFRFGSGMTFLGGFIGGAICFLAIYWFWRRKHEERLLDILAMLPSCILVAHGFGRIGCFFGGCCYGIESGTWLDVDFPYIGAHLPTQLYEAAFLFIMYAVVSYLYLRRDCRQTLSIYLISYGVFRFLIEFIRGDERGQFIGKLSPSQFWSILEVAAGVGVYFLIRWLWQKRDAELAAKAKNVSESAPAEKPAEAQGE